MYLSPNILTEIKYIRLRWADHVARIDEGSSAFKILTGKPSGKGSLGRPRRRWTDNVTLEFKEIPVSINTRNWNDSAQDRDYGKPL